MNPLKKLRAKYPPLDRQFKDKAWRGHNTFSPGEPQSVEELQAANLPDKTTRVGHITKLIAECVGKSEDDFHTYKTPRDLHVLFVHNGKLHHVYTGCWAVYRAKWKQVLSLLEEIEKIL